MAEKKSNKGIYILILICGIIIGAAGTVLLTRMMNSSDVQETQVESVEETQTEESDEIASDDPTPADETDLVVLRVNDAEVTMNEVNIYMYQLRDFYTAQYGEAPWDVEMEDGVTVRDYAKEELKKGLIRAEILISKADEYQVELVDEEKQVCAEEAKSYIASIGPVICQDFGLTEEADRLVKEKQYLSTKVYNAVLDSLEATLDDPSDAALSEAFDNLYNEWLESATITEDPVWEYIVMGSVG